MHSPADSPTEFTAEADIDSRKNSEVQAGFCARWVETVEELEQIKEPWNDLAKFTFQENLHFQPEFLIPAFKYLNNVNARILVIEALDVTGKNDVPVLCGLLPFEQKRFYHLPLTCYEIWRHEFCVDTTPLIRTDCALEVVRFVLDFLQKEGVSLLSMDTVSGDPQFRILLDKVLKEKNLACFERDAFSRAEFRRAATVEKFFEANISKNVRKKIRRFERRLREQGDLSVFVSDLSSDFEALADQFLALEASGWKGKQGTALESKASTENFFREMVQRSAGSGKIKFLSLNLDGQPVAMVCDLQNGEHGCAFKSAYDESFAQYSPGLLAEVKNIEYLHSSNITRMDSCTAPDNESINRIWRDRKEFQSLLIALKGGLPTLATAIMPTIQAAAKSAKQLLGK